MEIRIKASKMLKTLIGCGLSETEAKAIIFDLLMETNTPSVCGCATIDFRKPYSISGAVAESAELIEPTVEEEPIESVEEPTKSVEPKRKRVNFSNFGGEAQPLT